MRHDRSTALCALGLALSIGLAQAEDRVVPGDLDLTGETLTLDKLTFESMDPAITGYGDIQLGQLFLYDSLTIDSGITLDYIGGLRNLYSYGYNGSPNVTNGGTIRIQSGGSLNVQAPIENAGLFENTGGHVQISQAFSNYGIVRLIGHQTYFAGLDNMGTMEVGQGATAYVTNAFTGSGPVAIDGGKLVIYGDILSQRLDSLSATNGGQTLIYGMVDNTGHVLNTDGLAGIVWQPGSGIFGGTIRNSVEPMLWTRESQDQGSDRFVISDIRLDGGLRLGFPAYLGDIEFATGSKLYLSNDGNSITKGTDPVTFSGSGEVVIDTPEGGAYITTDNQFTLGHGMVMRPESATGGVNGSGKMINRGLLFADSTSLRLVPSGGVENLGQIRVKNGGSILATLTGSVGDIVSTNGYLSLSGDFQLDRSIAVSGGKFKLNGGTWTAPISVTNSRMQTYFGPEIAGPGVNDSDFSGTRVEWHANIDLAAAGGTLDLAAIGGTWQISRYANDTPTISNGTIKASASNDLLILGYLFMDNVTLDGPTLIRGDFRSYGAQITNTLNLTAGTTLTIDDLVSVGFIEGSDLTGQGQVLLTGYDNSQRPYYPGIVDWYTSIEGSDAVDDTVTSIGPDLTITAVQYESKIAGGTTLQNQGRIESRDLATLVLTANSEVINQGTLAVSGNSTITVEKLTGPVGDLEVRGGQMTLEGNYTFNENLQVGSLGLGGTLALEGTWQIDPGAAVQFNDLRVELRGMGTNEGSLNGTDVDLICSGTFSTSGSIHIIHGGGITLAQLSDETATMQLTGGQVDVPQLLFGLGNGRVNQTGGNLVTSLMKVSYQDEYALAGGEANIGTLMLIGNALLSLDSDQVDLVVTERFSMDMFSQLAVTSGARISLAGGDWANRSIDLTTRGQLAKLTVAVTGDLSDPTVFEASTADGGWSEEPVLGELAALIIGQDAPAAFTLIDLTDEDYFAPEALYVDTLTVGPGSVLILGDVKLYYRNGQIDPSASIDNPGNLVTIPEPTSLAVLALGAIGLLRRKKP